ncbi:MAG: SGNH/GDSL hydrolase family protein [Verrucomicrobiales bacterium]
MTFASGNDSVNGDIPVPVSRKKCAKLGIALIAALLALIISEVVVRLLRMAPEIKAIGLVSEDCVYKRSTNPLLGFELKANYRNADPDFIESYERTNAHGLRDRERSTEKPDGVRRVLLLGDSVVEGHGLPEQETISRQWEKLYPESSTEVLNFGVSAYCTLAEIELLEKKGLAFDPDVVVVLFVENDFDNFNREAFALGEAVQRPAPVKWLSVSPFPTNIHPDGCLSFRRGDRSRALEQRRDRG